MSYQKIPQPIAARVLKLAQDARVWAYAELPDGRFQRWESLTVGDCEQLTQAYVDRARKAIERFMLNGGSRHSAKTAAEYIDRANLYRLRYHELIGTQPEMRDLPFPHASVEEIATWENQ